jgi:hypothetical protein
MKKSIFLFMIFTLLMCNFVFADTRADIENVVVSEQINKEIDEKEPETRSLVQRIVTYRVEEYRGTDMGDLELEGIFYTWREVNPPSGYRYEIDKITQEWSTSGWHYEIGESWYWFRYNYSYTHKLVRN